MILVTGGAGFIGSNLVAALQAEGQHDVAVCDRFGNDEKWRNLAKHELAAVILPDQLDTFLARHEGQLTAIVHLGAISSTTETDVDLILRMNAQLSRHLWDWCTRTGTRFLYASSAATYGDGAAGFVEDWSVEGLARLQPLNAYGWSKHVFDRQVARLVASNAPRPPQWAGLKFFNVYGPNEYHKGEMMSVVRHLHPRLRAGEDARLFKSYRPDVPHGGQRRDFIWVGDACAVMLWLLSNPGANGLFNVGTGTARSFEDLARATFAAINASPRITYIEMPEALRAKYQYFTQASLDRLRAAGYDRPFTSLEEGVRQYVQGYLDRPDPYR